jgi:hypothetical protein
MAKQTPEEMWRQMLTGDVPGLQRMRRMWGALPSDPRCKLRNAPFRGPGGVLMRMLAFGPWPLNRRLCRWCIRSIHKHPGGAEIEVTVLLVDVRGSTTIAEQLPPGEYSKLLARFYGVAAEAIDDHNGIVDKFVGDGALALFIPGFAGSEHAAQSPPPGTSWSEPEMPERSPGFRSAWASTPGRRSSAASARGTRWTSPRSVTPSTWPRG